MNRTQIRCVALDFDGVVVDSMLVQEQIWRRVAKEVVGDEFVEDTIVANHYGGKAGDQIFDGLIISEGQRQNLRRRKNEIWFAERGLMPLLPGVKSILPCIKNAHFRTAIATTADRAYVEAVLSRELLASFIDVIVTNRDVEHGKPSPDIIKKIADFFNLRPREVLLIGDSASDMQMSKNADCAFIMLGKPTGGTDLVARDWLELAELLGLAN